MTDYAPEAMPSVQLSPIIGQRNENLAKAALGNLNDGQLLIVLPEYMTKRYGAQRAASWLMDMARQCEIAPWETDRRK